MRQVDREIVGNLACSVVESGDKYYFVSTVNLPLRRLESVMAEWRDDWWEPPYPNETMVWECDEQGERFGQVLHCQGYRKPESAIKTHHRLCGRLEALGSSVLNGRGFQTTKLEDAVPRGLFKEIKKKTKGLPIGNV